MSEYNHQKIEKKWQKIWERKGIYKTGENKKKPKYYILDMFPYPSGEGLHVGHPRGYIATDVYSRYMRMNGFNILHPMGWDAFGLPAENYAIKHKIHPKIAVAKNIKMFKRQLKAIGFDYDWSREINTTDANYYKWTQWIFLQFFKKGLAFQSFEPINWCPSCKTGLALEDLDENLCERCGSEVEKKPMRQWVLKITKYADRLLKDLNLLDWPNSIIEQQKNWIGQSHGAEIEFKIQNSKFKIFAFTTRLDTIFGCTYLVVAPEHLLLNNNELGIKNLEEVKKYIDETKKKTDLQRTNLTKEKIGVELKGVKALNPFNNEKVSVFVADYVLGSYGTGAVMAVPAHDERDFEFARKYKLPIKESILGGDISKIAFTEDGILVNSGKFSGLKSDEAREKMADWLVKNKFGKKAVNYKLQDWVFSRQRYWVEPIPIIHCNPPHPPPPTGGLGGGGCGSVAVPEKDLPVKLPPVKSYEPTGTGESPLANITKWVNVKCPKCRGPAKRETNTMPQWAGSACFSGQYNENNTKKNQPIGALYWFLFLPDRGISDI